MTSRRQKETGKYQEGPPPHANTWQRKRFQFVPIDDGLTHQSFTDECDVNNIINQHHRTGIVNHVARLSPQYGEVPDQTLFEAACAQAEIRSAAEDGFDFTPAEPEASSEADLDASASEGESPSTAPPGASEELSASQETAPD